MKKLVIIGANDFQNQLILKAKSMGYETHVFAWEQGAVGKENADYFYPISIVEKEEILQICKEIRPDGVVSIASDLAAVTVNYIGNQLDLKGYNSADCVLRSTNKYEMRRAFKSAGILTPQFQRVETAEKVNRNVLHLPVIVKPTDRSGSRAITKIESWEQLKDAIDRAVGESFEKCAIVEECITGAEYSCEGISYRGNHSLLAFTKKFTTEAPHFIETGHLQPAGLASDVEEEAWQTIQSALTALDVQFGATHTEFRVDEAGHVWIIEIGARMGGDCIGSDLVPLSTGYDFMKMVIDVSVGKEPDLSLCKHYESAGIRFVFSKDDLNAIAKVSEEYPENVCRIVEEGLPGSHAVVDSSTRFGYALMTDAAALKVLGKEKSDGKL